MNSYFSEKWIILLLQRCTATATQRCYTCVAPVRSGVNWCYTSISPNWSEITYIHLLVLKSEQYYCSGSIIILLHLNEHLLLISHATGPIWTISVTAGIIANNVPTCPNNTAAVGGIKPCYRSYYAIKWMDFMLLLH